MTPTVFILNGPNLNLLGLRETDVYGSRSLEDLERELKRAAAGVFELDFRQSNSEARLIGWLQEARDKAFGVVLNPAAYTHYSYAIRDAVAAIADCTAVIEVHLSNIYAREDFRSRSVVAAVCRGSIAGLGFDSYYLALKALEKLLD